jgi:ABC-type lipoprotein export system ATPase subunit
MSLLALQGVSKRYREPPREQAILRDISLEIDAGEFVVVYGPRRSGRTTVLRLAAGLEAPDTGTVTFRDSAFSPGAWPALGNDIGYVRKQLRAREEQDVLIQVASPLLARGLRVHDAHSQARRALERVGAESYTSLVVPELSIGEAMRVALARSMVLDPALLIVDEPTAGVNLSERDSLLACIRELAHDGVAVLCSTGDAEELAGADQALTLSEGSLRGPERRKLAPVVALRRSR